MKIGVLERPNDPCSLRRYLENCLAHLENNGVRVISFSESGSIPKGCDLVWEPALCMRRIPAILSICSVPIVGTMHGVKTFSLPLEELATEQEPVEELAILHMELQNDWEWFGAKVAAIIAVSNYAASEVLSAFSLDATNVYAVHLGICPKVFCIDEGLQSHSRPYLLHVSTEMNPIKNLNRVLAAYAALGISERCDLVVVLPGYEGENIYNGVRFIGELLPQRTLASWYRGARALVAPSLRETFGMPIVEAMACGCPVITSRGTGCGEVAGDAALLVDPRSTDDIAEAMLRIVADQDLCQQLRTRGLERARRFTWKAHADTLLEVFCRVTTGAEMAMAT